MKKKLMKSAVRYMAVTVLSGTMMVSLSGCGMLSLLNQRPEEPQPDYLTIEETPEPIATPEPQQPGDSTLSSNAPMISLNDSIEQLYNISLHYGKDRIHEQTFPNDDNSGWPIAEYQYEMLDIPSEVYQSLSDSVNEFNAGLVEEVEREYEDICDFALEEYEANGGENAEEIPTNVNYCISEQSIVKRADVSVFSFIESDYSYAGGAHGYQGYYTYNYDSLNGRPISLDEVFIDRDLAAETIAKELIGKYGADVFLEVDSGSDTPEEDQLVEILKKYYFPSDAESMLMYLIGYDGVYVYFNPYDISAYAFGILEVFLPFEEYNGTVLNDVYSITCDSYAYEMAGSPRCYSLESDTEDYITEYYAMLGNSGEITNISVDMQFEYDEYGVSGYNDITVKVGNNSVTTPAFAFEYTPYYIRSNEGSYIYVSTTVENDYTIAYVYDVSDGTPKFIDSFDGEVKNLNDPTCFIMHHRCNLLSTYDVFAYYTIGDDGMPELLSEDFEVSEDNSFILNLVSTEDIDCEVFPNGDLNEETVTETIPSGTTFYFKRTDMETYVIFETDTGKMLRMDVETSEDDFSPIVDGRSAYDVFETLWYAG